MHLTASGRDGCQEFFFFFKGPYSALDAANIRIQGSVRGVNRVCQDITSKPPGTAEWELRKIGCWVVRNELVRHCYL
ncbi:unnamed protein product [Musa hybrid cultivar]